MWLEKFAMKALTRFSFSIESDLAQRFEALIRSSEYRNRSEFIRDMIRDALVRRQWADEKAQVVGTLTLLYDHHRRQLGDRLIDIQHDHHEMILATTHVHLSHDLCLEVIILRGPAGRLRKLADLLRQQKGVLHAELSMSSTGKDLIGNH